MLIGGLRVLDIQGDGGSKHGVLTNKSEHLSNEFFKNLLDMNVAWTPVSDAKDIYQGSDRKTKAAK